MAQLDYAIPLLDFSKRRVQHFSVAGSHPEDEQRQNISSRKRIVLTVIKDLAGIAAVVFWLCPLRTGTQILVCVASIAVFLICHSVLTNLDETYAAKYGSAGYWPKPPID